MLCNFLKLIFYCIPTLYFTSIIIKLHHSPIREASRLITDLHLFLGHYQVNPSVSSPSLWKNTSYSFTHTASPVITQIFSTPPLPFALPQAQIQQAFPRNPQATSVRETGRKPQIFTSPPHSSKSNIQVSYPALWQATCLLQPIHTLGPYSQGTKQLPVGHSVFFPLVNSLSHTLPSPSTLLSVSS